MDGGMMKEVKRQMGERVKGRSSRRGARKEKSVKSNGSAGQNEGKKERRKRK